MCFLRTTALRCHFGSLNGTAVIEIVLNAGRLSGPNVGRSPPVGRVPKAVARSADTLWPELGRRPPKLMHEFLTRASAIDADLGKAPPLIRSGLALEIVECTNSATRRVHQAPTASYSGILLSRLEALTTIEGTMWFIVRHSFRKATS